MTVLTGSATVPAESPWWPDLELAPEPELPPDPDADLLPVVRDEPDEWGELSVYDLVDDADRADLDRLLRLDEVEVADRLATADGELPAVPAAIVARVADGADVHGEPISLITAVSELAGIDPQVLDGAARVDLIAGWERVLAMVAGEQQLALAAVAEATMGFGLTGMDARHEVGAALRLAPGTAAERTEVALALTERLGDTLVALRRGEVSWRQAADLAVAVRELPDALAAAVQARVLPRMGDRTAAESRRAVQAAVVAADPDGAAQRATKAARSRRIDRLGQPDSMAAWAMCMPAQVEGDLWAEVTRRARASRAALRAAGCAVGTGLDALRVDSVIDALLGPGAAARLIRQLDTEDTDDTDEVQDALDTQDVDEAGEGQVAPDAAADDESAGDESAGDVSSGDGATVLAGVVDLLRAGVRGGSPYLPRCSCGGKQVAAVVLDLPTALGLAANPGVIPGYGAVPAALARAMAADRDWVRWTTDPGTRRLIDRGAHTYRPAADMAAYLAARDRVCGFPGCSRRAQDCDCDHVVNFGLPDGRTIAINLGLLCRQHHNAKTHGRWKLSYDPDTAIKTWTSPLGKTYTTGTDPPLA